MAYEFFYRSMASKSPSNSRPIWREEINAQKCNGNYNFLEPFPHVHNNTHTPTKNNQSKLPDAYNSQPFSPPTGSYHTFVPDISKRGRPFRILAEKRLSFLQPRTTLLSFLTQKPTLLHVAWLIMFFQWFLQIDWKPHRLFVCKKHSSVSPC